LDAQDALESFAFPGPLRFSVCAARLETSPNKSGDTSQASALLDAFISALHQG
jgi:hypothetical protein